MVAITWVLLSRRNKGKEAATAVVTSEVSFVFPSRGVLMQYEIDVNDFLAGRSG